MSEMSTADALYVHVPFCVRKCRYCDFFSVAGGEDLVPRYLAAVQRELRRQRANLRVRTVYVGGGTPTSLSPDALKQLMESLTEADLSQVEEFTVEANPGTLTKQKCAVLRDARVNRVSVGVQSLRSQTLQVLGRIHTAGQARAAVVQARTAGFAEISVDLIFAVPGQTLSDVAADLEGVIGMDVEHVSAYSLTYEEGTPLWEDRQAGRVQPVSEDLELEMYRLVRRRLREAGFEHYEISSFARPGRRSRHNQVYWRNEPYVGIGPGAATYLSRRRRTNVRDVRRYVELVESGTDPAVESETLGVEARARETLVMGLRMLEGVDETEFARRTGFRLETLADEEMRRLSEEGFLAREGGRVRLSERGLEVADSVLAELV